MLKQEIVTPTDKRHTIVRSKILDLIAQNDLPSISLAVAKDGRVIWQEAFGWADREQRIKGTPHTIYPIASLSKSITATGLMILVERGQVHLDDPVDKYIAPAKLTVYEGKAADVTVKHSLTMTAGIPHGWISQDKAYNPLSPKEFVERHGIVVAPPGTAFEYSNFSFGLPEAIIAAVSGQSFANFMRKEVFIPLGMTRTSVGIGAGLEAFVAAKYEADQQLIPHTHFIPAGAGGLYASAHDLVRYGIFHLKNNLPDQKKILKDETLDAMHVVTDEGWPNSIMGLGWGSVALDNGLLWLISNGSIGGATSSLMLVPADNLAVVVLTNITSQSPSIADQMAIEITDSIVPGFAEKSVAFIEQYEAENTLDPYRPTSQLTGQWRGEIKTKADNVPITMVFQEGDIHIQLKDQYKTLLNETQFGGGRLQGTFLGKLPNNEEFQYDHPISLDMKLQEGKLYGAATAYFQTDKGAFSLPSYVYLMPAE